MNCGIYAVLRALEDLGHLVSKSEFELPCREQEGTNPAWLKQNIIPVGYCLGGPYPPDVHMLRARMLDGDKALGRLPGETGEAHMVYIKNIANNEIMAEDNSHHNGLVLKISELTSVYFLFKM